MYNKRIKLAPAAKHLNDLCLQLGKAQKHTMKFDDAFKAKSHEVLALFDEDILKEATISQATFQKVEIDLSDKPAGKIIAPQKARRNARHQQLIRQLEFLSKKGI